VVEAVQEETVGRLGAALPAHRPRVVEVVHRGADYGAAASAQHLGEVVAERRLAGAVYPVHADACQALGRQQVGDRAQQVLSRHRVTISQTALS
jgi:hypothetical protein